MVGCGAIRLRQVDTSAGNAFKGIASTGIVLEAHEALCRLQVQACGNVCLALLMALSRLAH